MKPPDVELVDGGPPDGQVPWTLARNMRMDMLIAKSRILKVVIIEFMLHTISHGRSDESSRPPEQAVRDSRSKATRLWKSEVKASQYTEIRGYYGSASRAAIASAF
jgi:hypothetical protein